MALSLIKSSSLASGAGGKILQAVTHVTEATTYFAQNSTANTHQLLNTTNANDGTSHMSVTITPSATTSKIMIMVNLNYALNGADVFSTLFALDRSGTLLLPSGYSSRRPAIAVATPINGATSSPAYMNTQYMLFVDEPSTTSARTYTVTYASTSNANTARLWLNRCQTDTDSATYERGISTLVAQEIGA